MAKKKTKVELEFAAKTSEFDESIKKMNAEIKTQRKELKLNATELKGDADNADLLAQRQKILAQEQASCHTKISALNSTLNEAKRLFGEDSKEVKQLNDKLIDAKTQLAGVENEIKSTDAKLDALRNSTDDAANEFDDLGESVEQTGKDANNSANGGFTVLKGVISNLAANVIRSAVDKLREFGKSVIETGKSFDKNMSQVAATMGTTVDQISEMEDKAKEMGATTAWTSTEAAEALNYLALAGYSAEQSASTLPTVLNLASAGAMDLGAASDMVTDAMTALGIEADAEGKNITNFGDQMAKTSSRSNTSLSQLGEAILTIGGTAKNLSGGTIELNTALGILADNSIKGSEGGTHLRNILLALNPTTDKAIAAWKQLGISAYDADGNLRPLQDTFGDLNKAMVNMTSQEKTEILAQMFNKTDLSSVNALLATSSTRWNELGSAIENSGRAMEEMAETQLDNLEGDLTLMESAMDGFKQSVFDEIEQPIRDVIQGFTGLINGSDIASGLLKNGLLSFSGVLDGVISKIWNKFKIVVNAISSAFSEILPNILNGLVSILPAIVNVVFTIIFSIITAITDSIPTLLPTIVSVVIAICNTLINNIPVLIDAAVNLLLAVVDAIPIIVPQLIEALPYLINSIVNGLVKSTPILLTGAVNAFTSIVLALPIIGQSLTENGKKLVSSFLNCFTIIPRTIENLFNSLKYKIRAPHISVTYSTEGTLAKVAEALGLQGFPKLHINWNKFGGVFENKTIVAQGFAEAGDAEMALPLNDRSTAPFAANIASHMPSNDYSGVLHQIYNEIVNGNGSLTDKIVDAVVNRVSFKWNRREMVRAEAK